MTEPYFRQHVFCCTNERPAGHERGSCKARGADPLRNYMKARIKELGIDGARVNVAGCLDRCEKGPVMVIYPEGVWYTYASQGDIDEIIDTHIKGGAVVERLRLSNDD
jgi:(2Fe-2S) ferredoxin